MAENVVTTIAQVKAIVLLFTFIQLHINIIKTKHTLLWPMGILWKQHFDSI